MNYNFKCSFIKCFNTMRPLNFLNVNNLQRFGGLNSMWYKHNQIRLVLFKNLKFIGQQFIKQFGLTLIVVFFLKNKSKLKKN